METKVPTPTPNAISISFPVFSSFASRLTSALSNTTFADWWDIQVNGWGAGAGNQRMVLLSWSGCRGRGS